MFSFGCDVSSLAHSRVPNLDAINTSASKKGLGRKSSCFLFCRSAAIGCPKLPFSPLVTSNWFPSLSKRRGLFVWPLNDFASVSWIPLLHVAPASEAGSEWRPGIERIQTGRRPVLRPSHVRWLSFLDGEKLCNLCIKNVFWCTILIRQIF